MSYSDSLDNITLDSDDILTIERFENNYYNHKNNVLQIGGVYTFEQINDQLTTIFNNILNLIFKNIDLKELFPDKEKEEAEKKAKADEEAENEELKKKWIEMHPHDRFVSFAGFLEWSENVKQIKKKEREEKQALAAKIPQSPAPPAPAAIIPLPPTPLAPPAATRPLPAPTTTAAATIRLSPAPITHVPAAPTPLPPAPSAPAQNQATSPAPPTQPTQPAPPAPAPASAQTTPVPATEVSKGKWFSFFRKTTKPKTSAPAPAPASAPAQTSWFKRKFSSSGGGNNKKKLKKNIIRLYNCYILSQNQNGGANNKLSLIIKKRLDKKISELKNLEGGTVSASAVVGADKERYELFLTLLKKKIKDELTNNSTQINQMFPIVLLKEIFNNNIIREKFAIDLNNILPDDILNKISTMYYKIIYNIIEKIIDEQKIPIQQVYLKELNNRNNNINLIGGGLVQDIKGIIGKALIPLALIIGGAICGWEIITKIPGMITGLGKAGEAFTNAVKAVNFIPSFDAMSGHRTTVNLNSFFLPPKY
jgi:hypothetical protein